MINKFGTQKNNMWPQPGPLVRNGLELPLEVPQGHLHGQSCNVLINVLFFCLKYVLQSSTESGSHGYTLLTPIYLCFCFITFDQLSNYLAHLCFMTAVKRAYATLSFRECAGFRKTKNTSPSYKRLKVNSLKPLLLMCKIYWEIITR